MEEKEQRYTFLGFFVDSTREDDFQQASFQKNLPQIRSIFLLTGLSFFLLLLPDLFLMTNPVDYWITSTLRLLYLGISLYFYRENTSFPSHQLLSRTFFLYLLLGIVFFSIILTRYQIFYWSSKSYGILLILLYLFFLIPISIGQKNILSLLLCICFVSISLLQHQASPVEATSFCLYILLSLFFFNTVVTYINRIQRDNFTKENRLAILNTKDPLTGIANRLKFNECMEQNIRFTRRYRTPLTLILMDIDGLQAINNRYGQSTGDRVLIEFTQVIQKNIREIDFLARVGGDEFTLLLPNTREVDSIKVRERLKEKVQEHFSAQNKQVTISCGSASFQEGDTFISLIKRADSSLFTAKKRRRQAY